MLCEKGGWKPDRCRQCWNYRRKLLPSELTNTIEHFIVYVHRNEAHFTYIYVYHTNVYEADNIYKNPPPKCHVTYICCYFYFALRLHPWLGWLLERSQTPSCERQMQGWVALAGCPPPNKKRGNVGGDQVGIARIEPEKILQLPGRNQWW